MRGLYIHIPFCKSKCKYCGFYSITQFDKSLISKYTKALLKEFELYKNYEFDTIYIGGGTPSILAPVTLSDFLNKLLSLLKKEPLEFTIEANPESLSPEKLKILKEYGVNRISLGVQSMNNNVLKFLGRIHTQSDVYRATYFIKKFGFNFNVDLIYDIPNIDEEITIKSLKKLCDLAPNHISAYSYSFDTLFLSESPPVEKTSMYKIRNLLQEKGYIQYEISNFAKPGFQCKHNIIYWKMHDYIGLGAAAHSMINKKHKRIRWSHCTNIFAYIQSPFQYENYTIIRNKDVLIENLIFGLRMIEGVDIAIPIELNIMKNIDGLTHQGLLTIKGDKVCLTEKGLLYLDYVQEYLYTSLFA
ncbi:radical SAM family heme chaperone HemW [Deferribacter autotrophicus]|uniref:Heme chaperone HemW n=1 Tax=Deferribacter autotrophicus TaxID=500465 RepID=A0A5A8F5L9_9BACT|nr:radical SAM family heme chaperone HemW [Deferribacter autotrophicus]KAA0258990.1 radical SAM family heme chaperone HemW [Deferribacter autotrophicus]